MADDASRAAGRWIEPDRRPITDPVLGFFDQSGWSLTEVRALAEAGAVLDRPRWSELGASGHFLPAGGEQSLARSAVVAEEWGRALGQGPFVESVVVQLALSQLGSESHRTKVGPDIVAGRQLATWAASSIPGYWGSGSDVQAESSPAGFVLNGSLPMVLDAGAVDWILMSARDGAGVSQFLIPTGQPGLRLDRLDSLDITRAFYTVTLTNVEVPVTSLVGARAVGTDGVARQVRTALVLATAMTTGSMGHIFDVALQYAKDRTAFGRPIGSFQAIKHLLVDASLKLETSRAMCDAAAQAVDEETPDADEIVSMAKAYVADAGVDVAHAVWQSLGGISYMWENDFHLFLRRITTDAALFGTAQWHNERICELHSLAAQPTGEQS
jgi:alkylation response protein AidB-like acyl-CoA dehydrogenase